MPFGRTAWTAIVFLLCGLLPQITGCTSRSETSTYWYPAQTTDGKYSNQDGIGCFEFSHQAGVKFTLYITGNGHGTEFNFLGAFLIPRNVKQQLAEQAFVVRDSDHSSVVVKIENLTVLDESLNRTVAIPADHEVIGTSNLALVEDRRHKYCSFISERFQIFADKFEASIPTIRINGVNWLLPKLFLEKHPGKVSRSFSP